MSRISRRQFSTLMAASGLSALRPLPLLGQARPSVVIVGGGAGGATAARYLARDSKGKLEVTLVQDSAQYTTCFYSNLYLGGYRSFESITHRYDKLASEHGVRFVQQRAENIDRQARLVRLRDGSTLAYDRLVLAPGIDLVYDSVAGYSQDASQWAPHAWQGGPQTELLKHKLDALQNGQNIVMVAPPNPYRCPPGPYERVSMMAHVLKSKGFTDSRIYVIDTKDAFSKQALFDEGWARHYPEMIEWYGPEVHGGIVQVDAQAGFVETDLDRFEGDLLNIIPAQRAGAIAASAELVDGSGYCPIDARSMRSQQDENIFVIGDACIAGAMPKSGFSANSQARVAAMMIRGELLGSRTFAARYSNTCWSLIDTDDGVKVGAQYVPGEDGLIQSTSSFISQPGESAAVRKATYEQSISWYAAITADMFG